MNNYEEDKSWIEGLKEIRRDYYKNKPVVCCATCHNECAPYKKKLCFTETNTFLWWNQKLGYHQKIHENLSYAFWEPKPEGFITKGEFCV